MKKFFILLVTVINSLVVSTFAQTGGAVFEAGPVMNRTRIAPVISMLDNGKVIAFGGRESGFISSSYADIYDPTANSFSEVAMNTPRDFPAVCKLANGNFLIAGGAMNLGVAPGYNTADIYNPNTNTFTATGNMNNARCSFAAAQLNNGKVLVAGAWYNSQGASTAELYDPVAGTFATTGNLIQERSNPLVLPTTDGGAIVASGYPTFGGTGYTDVEYYNSTSGTFSTLSTQLIAADSGWIVAIDAHRMPYQNYQRNNGKYLILSYRYLPSLEFALLEFDPATKLFSKITTSAPLVDTLTDAGFFGFALNKSDDIVYLLGIKAGSDPQQLNVVGVNLNNGFTFHPNSSHALPQGEYLSPTMMYVPSLSKILLMGVASAPDNFSATNKTYLIAPSAATSVNELDANTVAIKCYPNPTSAYLTIDADLTEQGSYLIRFQDIAGREVWSESRHAEKGKNKWMFNNVELAPGIYNVVISGNGIFSGSNLVVVR
ncbi:MAG: hypothetical protein KIS94_11500 [Chitinophagales bacterium]|nr:hypothetical protein [Chitinophagales bacterium]